MKHFWGGGFPKKVAEVFKKRLIAKEHWCRKRGEGKKNIRWVFDHGKSREKGEPNAYVRKETRERKRGDWKNIQSKGNLLLGGASYGIKNTSAGKRGGNILAFGREGRTWERI